MNRDPAAAPDPPVAIVGAGPTGLSMAVGLARLGVRSVILEQKPTTSRTSKAPGLHVRTREIFRQWGIEERFLESGELWRSFTMHNVAAGRGPIVSLDFSELAVEVDRPGLLILEQNETERLLLEAVRESGLCDVRFEAEVVRLEQDADGARVTYRQNGETRTLHAEYVVGCDGAGSFVRDALGLPFEGTTYSLRPVLADVRVDDGRDELPQPRTRTGAGGYRFGVRLKPGLWRVVHLPRGEPKEDEVSDAEVQELVDELLGSGRVEVVWSERFRIHVRSSPRFRVGRVLLAGDAAHVHSPTSGFGMNGGIQDAHNLAWKLASALDGGDADRLLESFEVERRAAVVETTSRYTDVITRIFIQAPRLVRETAWFAARALLEISAVRLPTLRRTSMLDLRYPASPLLRRRDRARGVRLPNPLLRSPDDEAVRLYDLLPSAPVILDVADQREFATDLPVQSVVRIGPGAYEEPTGLLRGLLGRRDGWILVRPDGYIAWARHHRDGMAEAVRDALGASRPARARPAREPATARRASRTQAGRRTSRSRSDHPNRRSLR